TSNTDCGFCGHNCSLPNATSHCVNNGQTPCDNSNTKCEIDQCECTGPGNCWWDLDKLAITGCEYQCDPTNGGVGICGDGIDNDCDGKIDGADNLSQDPQIGVPCWGKGFAPGFTTNQSEAVGACASNANQGTTQCLGSQIVCVGALNQNDDPETCNGI